MRKAGSETTPNASKPCDPNARYRANPDFKLREIAGEFILVPTGEAAVQLNGLITLNESGRLLWERLQQDCGADDLTAALLSEYQVDAQTAQTDVQAFLEKMKQAGTLLKP